MGHFYLLPKFRLDLNLLHKAFRAVFRGQALRDKNQTWKTWHIGAFPDCSDSKGTPIFFWKPTYLRIEFLGPQVLVWASSTQTRSCRTFSDSTGSPVVPPLQGMKIRAGSQDTRNCIRIMENNMETTITRV